MILITILIFALVIFAIVAVMLISIGGVLFIIPIADIIVCIFIIVLIIKAITKRRRK